jgi:hypothetical protein
VIGFFSSVNQPCKEKEVRLVRAWDEHEGCGLGGGGRETGKKGNHTTDSTFRAGEKVGGNVRGEVECVIVVYHNLNVVHPQSF